MTRTKYGFFSARQILPEQKASAFTLIELLVVIAIIAILAALLMPAVARSKQKAYQANCAGNLKQLGYAIQMYVDEHNDKLPGPLWIGLYPVYNTETERLPFYLTTYLSLPAPSTNAQTAQVAICPAAVRVEPMPAKTPIDSLSVPISYMVCDGATNSSADILTHPFGYPYMSPNYRSEHQPDDPPKKVSQILSPANKWAVTDVDQDNAFPASYYYEFISPNKVHGKVRNQLFFDWHVQAVKDEDDE